MQLLAAIARLNTALVRLSTMNYLLYKTFYSCVFTKQRPRIILVAPFGDVKQPHNKNLKLGSAHNHGNAG